MPWTRKQQKFFHEAAENPTVAREHGIGQGEARQLAAESDKLARQGNVKPAVKANFQDLTHIFKPKG